MEDYDYVKVLLYAFPKLSALADAAEDGAKVKAALSFRTQDALACAEQVSRLMADARTLRRLFCNLENMVALLDEEECYLLEYKYFRRKGELAGRFSTAAFPASERQYFRRQGQLLKKVAYLLRLWGMTRECYFAEIHPIAPFPRVYRAVKEGREFSVIRKRSQRGLRFQNGSSCGEGFLPRSMRTTMTTMPAAVAQRTAICRGDGEAEGSLVSSEAEAGISSFSR